MQSAIAAIECYFQLRKVEKSLLHLLDAFAFGSENC